MKTINLHLTPKMTRFSFILFCLLIFVGCKKETTESIEKNATNIFGSWKMSKSNIELNNKGFTIHFSSAGLFNYKDGNGKVISGNFSVKPVDKKQLLRIVFQEEDMIEFEFYINKLTTQQLILEMVNRYNEPMILEFQKN
mgnify:CR=1 FL=1